VRPRKHRKSVRPTTARHVKCAQACIRAAKRLAAWLHSTASATPDNVPKRHSHKLRFERPHVGPDVPQSQQNQALALLLARSRRCDRHFPYDRPDALSCALLACSIPVLRGAQAIRQKAVKSVRPRSTRPPTKLHRHPMTDIVLTRKLGEPFPAFDSIEAAADAIIKAAFRLYAG
jgi:hypothetical protein